jgi:transketolase
MPDFKTQCDIFVYYLHIFMSWDERIFVLTADVGHGILDKIRSDFPDRFINVGAAEQSLLDIGVGLAMSGKIPVCYSMTPFILYRGFETIRNYIDHEKIPVIMVGRGRGREYKNCGFSHWSEEDKDVMKLFKNIKSYWPEKKDEICSIMFKSILCFEPVYINFSKK